MKCARSAVRVAQRVDFCGPPAARAADRLFMLPLFRALRAMRFDRGGVDGQSHAVFTAAGERFKDRPPMAALAQRLKR